MDETVRVEIIAYAPTAFYHCTHCEIVWNQTGFSRNVRAEQLQSGLPEDLAVEYQAVSDWVRRIFSRHGESIVVKVIDAASIEGFLKTARHRLRSFPAVILDGRERFYGTDFAAADQAIDRRLRTPAGA